MSEMKVMLAETYADQDPTGWFLSEKLDGVRAVWTGTRFLSREGNEFFAPAWFTAKLPTAIVLDGELTMGRGRFLDTVGAVKTKVPKDADWADIHYLVFDLPEHPGTLEERYREILRLEARFNFCAVQQTHCKGREHMKEVFEHILALKGEGVMLRLPASRYEFKRSHQMLKVKPVLSLEAKVTDYLPGEGRNAGRTGALICDFNGIRIRVGAGMSDKDRENPPAIGSIITFECTELNPSGAPRFARFIGVRNYE